MHITHSSEKRSSKLRRSLPKRSSGQKKRRWPGGMPDSLALFSSAYHPRSSRKWTYRMIMPLRQSGNKYLPRRQRGSSKSLALSSPGVSYSIRPARSSRIMVTSGPRHGTLSVNRSLSYPILVGMSALLAMHAWIVFIAGETGIQ